MLSVAESVDDIENHDFHHYWDHLQHLPLKRLFLDISAALSSLDSCVYVRYGCRLSLYWFCRFFDEIVIGGQKEKEEEEPVPEEAKEEQEETIQKKEKQD